MSNDSDVDGNPLTAVLVSAFFYPLDDGMRVPYWGEVLTMSRQVSRAVGLGYVGVDIVVDADAGPMLLEANARPGLAIQIANGQGLLPRLQAIDKELTAKSN